MKLREMMDSPLQVPQEMWAVYTEVGGATPGEQASKQTAVALFVHSADAETFRKQYYQNAGKLKLVLLP